MESIEWRKLAGRLVRFINFAWWFDRWNALLLAASLIGAAAILIFRNQQVELSPSASLIIVTAVVLLLAVTAWLLARKHFVRLEDAYVRLEKVLHLNNALSTACAGVGPWPSLPPADRTGGYTWRWSRLLGPTLLAASILAASFLVPTAPLAADDRSGPQEPPAWEDIESWLKELEEKDAAEKTDLERTAERVAELRNQPEEEWYRHSSMEATDTLKQQLAESIRRLEKNAATANRSLGALKNHASRLTDTDRRRLASEYSDALRGMQSGELRPNAALLESLKNTDLNKLSSLSPDQIRQLRDALDKTSGACSQCLGAMASPAAWSNDSDLLWEESSGAPGLRFPEGGSIQRGPGEAPISLSDQRSDLGSNNLEEVASKDYSRATFGDTLAVGEGEHEIDKSSSGSRSAGAVRSTGEGGERVWRDALLPSEREILGRYFK